MTRHTLLLRLALIIFVVALVGVAFAALVSHAASLHPSMQHTQQSAQQPLRTLTVVPSTALNGKWALFSWSGADQPYQDIGITLQFDPTDHTFFGFAGCNWYGGSYAVSGYTITFSDFQITLMACRATMTQEGRYLDLFSQVSLFQLQGTTLILMDASQQHTLTFVPIPG
jgi:heat shock protein HslJ